MGSCSVRPLDSVSSCWNLGEPNGNSGQRRDRRRPRFDAGKRPVVTEYSVRYADAQTQSKRTFNKKLIGGGCAAHGRTFTALGMYVVWFKVLTMTLFFALLIIVGFIANHLWRQYSRKYFRTGSWLT